MSDNQYKVPVNLNMLDTMDSLGYIKKAERWDNVSVLFGCISIIAVLYYYF